MTRGDGSWGRGPGASKGRVRRSAFQKGVTWGAGGGAAGQKGPIIRRQKVCPSVPCEPGSRMPSCSPLRLGWYHHCTGLRRKSRHRVTRDPEGQGGSFGPGSPPEPGPACCSADRKACARAGLGAASRFSSGGGLREKNVDSSGRRLRSGSPRTRKRGAKANKCHHG